MILNKRVLQVSTILLLSIGVTFSAWGSGTFFKNKSARQSITSGAAKALPIARWRILAQSIKAPFAKNIVNDRYVMEWYGLKNCREYQTTNKNILLNRAKASFGKMKNSQRLRIPLDVKISPTGTDGKGFYLPFFAQGQTYSFDIRRTCSSIYGRTRKGVAARYMINLKKDQNWYPVISLAEKTIQNFFDQNGQPKRYITGELVVDLVAVIDKRSSKRTIVFDANPVALLLWQSKKKTRLMTALGTLQVATKSTSIKSKSDKKASPSRSKKIKRVAQISKNKASSPLIEPVTTELVTRKIAKIRRAPTTKENNQISTSYPGQRLEVVGRIAKAGHRSWIVVRLPNNGKGYIAESLTMPKSKWDKQNKVQGKVGGVVDTATIKVAGQRVKLWGITGESGNMAGKMAVYINAQGNNLKCEKKSNGRYRCLTPSGIDIAEAVLLNGAARTTSDASRRYKKIEKKAKQRKRGIWSGR